MAQPERGSEYLMSIPGFLKIIEFISLLIAIGTVGYFLDEVPDGFFDGFDKKGNLQFFMGATVVSWLIVMALFVLFIAGLHSSSTNWTLVVVIISAVCTVFLLISSSLVAVTARKYDKKKLGSITSACKLLDLEKTGTDARCWHLLAGAICGFIAMALFAVDTAIHFCM